MKIGDIFYSKQKDSEWMIWHEIIEINGERVTIRNYGKDTPEKDVVFRKCEIAYCLRKRLLIPA